MVSGTWCPAWSDQPKQWSGSRAAAPKSRCPEGHRGEFSHVLRGHIWSLLRHFPCYSMGIWGLSSFRVGRGMDGHTYGNSPLCPTGHRPFGAAAQKGGNNIYDHLDIWILSILIFCCLFIFYPVQFDYKLLQNKRNTGDGSLRCTLLWTC